MKKLLIYYSHDGNTKFVAETISKIIEADIMELIPEENINITGIMKISWGVRQLITHPKPKLLRNNINPSDYDMIVIGTPVWSYTFSPPINTFFNEYKLSGKKVAIFCCHGGQKGKTIEKIKECLKGNIIIGENDFLEPLKYRKEENLKKIIEWANNISK
ncbi:flavodoxin family protein [Clostridium cuniculi]|uniref:flavodoxin family protein n=1 Tax=Clostridium cuniculi TaxID=2548455 RepID=UPI0010550302|nr:flavodoxin [Clostridium cuniculi]